LAKTGGVQWIPAQGRDDMEGDSWLMELSNFTGPDQPPLSQLKLPTCGRIFLTGDHPVGDGPGTRLDPQETWLFIITGVMIRL
jgi:hypothetical protein